MTRSDEMDGAARQRAREEWARTIFDHDVTRHDRQHRSVDQMFPVNPCAASTHVSPLVVGSRPLRARLNLPGSSSRFLGVPPLAIDLDQFWNLIGSRGVLVWHDGAVVHEQYWHGHGPDTRWMSNSASKLVVAMLVARALGDGALGSLDGPLTAYWPELVGTAWDGVTVEQCLSMTTGIDFEEEELDLLRDDTPYAILLDHLINGSIEDFVIGRPRRAEPGTELVYSSLDTEALGGVLIRAVGEGIASYLNRTVWEPAGMATDAYWLADGTGRELALSGLCATLPDYARLGLVLLHDGAWNGHQVVPTEFTRRLSHPGAETLTMDGHDDYPLVCWDQAFIPNNVQDQAGDFMAAGSYGQFIYVNPSTSTVIAHHGIHRDITTEYVDMYRAFMAFRQISEDLVLTGEGSIPRSDG